MGLVSASLRHLTAAFAISTVTAGCASSSMSAPGGPAPARRAAFPAWAPPYLVARARSGREPGTDAFAWWAIAFAWQQVGKPYCWGGTGPGCFDCSGLVQRAWTSVGVHLPRTADEMAARLDAVRLDQVRAGDILWWPGHVALYAGYGWAIEALDAHDGVVKRPAKNPERAFRPRAGG